MQRQHDLDNKQIDYTDAEEKFAYTTTYLLDLSNRAYELFKSSRAEQKRRLINFSLSNLKLKDGLLDFNLKPPFNAIVNAHKSSNWLRSSDSNREPSA